MRLLEWRDLDLNAGLMHLRAETTKARRAASLPLPPFLRETLRAWKPRAPNPAVLCSVPDPRTLRGDLMRAGIPPITSQGKIDIHALRVSFATLLARSGAPIASAQRLLRHSSPVLTLRVYQRMTPDDLASAARLLGSTLEPARDLAIGLDHQKKTQARSEQPRPGNGT